MSIQEKIQKTIGANTGNPIKIGFSITYSFARQSNSYIGELFCYLPVNQQKKIPEDLRDNSTEFFGEKLDSSWGWLDDRGRCIYKKVAALDIPDLETIITSKIKEELVNLKRVKEKNDQSFPELPENEEFIVELK